MRRDNHRIVATTEISVLPLVAESYTASRRARRICKFYTLLVNQGK